MEMLEPILIKIRSLKSRKAFSVPINSLRIKILSSKDKQPELPSLSRGIQIQKTFSEGRFALCRDDFQTIS